MIDLMLNNINTTASLMVLFMIVVAMIASNKGMGRTLFSTVVGGAYRSLLAVC